MDEMAGGRRGLLLFAEEGDLKGDARVTDSLNPKPGVHRFRKAEGMVKPATGFHGLWRNFVLEPIDARLFHLEAHHDGLNVAVIDDVVDVAQHVIIGQTGGNRNQIREIVLQEAADKNRNVEEELSDIIPKAYAFLRAYLDKENVTPPTLEELGIDPVEEDEISNEGELFV